jgi:basic membrane lipoprotein Med (substrate-binding protein (PBP1-ABC) superfamily)
MSRSPRAAPGIVLLLALIACAGCGAKTKPERTVAKGTSAPPLLRVGIVGQLDVSVPRVEVTRGTLIAVQRLPLVLVAAGSVGDRAVSSIAAANAGSHFALVGASVQGVKQPNLVGIRFQETQAAQLGGILAGYVSAVQGVADPPVAWVGPGNPALIRSFIRGVRQVVGGVEVLVVRSPSLPASCKEAALTAILHGAVVVMAHTGLCAAAVANAAAEQNQVAASVGDFELPDAAVEAVVRSAINGSYSGGEDVTFGLATGAIGVRRLDPRIPAAVAVQMRAAAQALASGRRPASE